MEDFYKIKHVSQPAFHGASGRYAWVESCWGGVEPAADNSNHAQMAMPAGSEAATNQPAVALKKKDQKYVSAVYVGQIPDPNSGRAAGAVSAAASEAMAAGAVSETASCTASTAVQLTAASDSQALCSEHSPAFSADGTSLYFLSDASGETQVWKADCSDLSVQQLTHLRHGVLSFQAAPDESALLLFTEVWPEEESDGQLLSNINVEWTDADREADRKRKE